MPRKPKYTREQVIASAFEVARKSGIDSVTAVSVAANMGYTGSSLFTHFDSMDDLKSEVLRVGRQQVIKLLNGSLDYVPSFKEFGMRWVRFAKAEPNLYKMIFVGNPFVNLDEKSGEFTELFSYMRNEVQNTFMLSDTDAVDLINECITQANGISHFVIDGLSEYYSEERISMELSSCCLGRVLLLKAKEGKMSLEMATKFASAVESIPVKKK